MEPQYYFSEIVAYSIKQWKIMFEYVELMTRNINNQYEYVQMFILIFRKCGQFSLRCGQYCPHFLEIVMYTRVYPGN